VIAPPSDLILGFRFVTHDRRLAACTAAVTPPKVHIASRTMFYRRAKKSNGSRWISVMQDFVWLPYFADARLGKLTLL
jgi:hypothetical protein